MDTDAETAVDTCTGPNTGTDMFAGMCWHRCMYRHIQIRMRSHRCKRRHRRRQSNQTMGGGTCHLPHGWGPGTWHGRGTFDHLAWHGMAWQKSVKPAPVAVGGWFLTDGHDLAPCAANSLHRADDFEVVHDITDFSSTCAYTTCNCHFSQNIHAAFEVFKNTTKSSKCNGLGLN